MKKTGIIFLSLAVGFIQGVNAENINEGSVAQEQVAPGLSSSAASQDEQTQWRNEMKKLEKERRSYNTAGIVGALAGVGIFIAGVSDISSAGSSNGCQKVDLFTIECDTEQHRQEAQDKLDSGKRKQLGGLVVGLVGAVFLYAGSNHSNKIQALQRKGKQKGFTLALRAESTDEMALVGSFNF